MKHIWKVLLAYVDLEWQFGEIEYIMFTDVMSGDDAVEAAYKRFYNKNSNKLYTCKLIGLSYIGCGDA